jgi:hypothetical protein
MKNIFVHEGVTFVLLEKLLLMTLFFPYIPALIRSTDTQPTFTLLILALFGYVLLKKQAENPIIRLSNSQIFVLLSVLFLAFFSVSVNAVLTNEHSSATRVFSYVQFVFAILFGMYSKLELDKNDFRKVLLTYVIFTIIFYLSKGTIEDLLIGSRNESTAELLSTGRGAKTLSPEPAQFALQVFNIIIIYYLWFAKDGHKLSLTLFALAAFCFLSSLSGFGMVLLALLIFARHPRVAWGLFFSILAIAPFVVNYLESIGANRRMFQLLVLLFKGGLVKLYQQDSSIGTRLGSFFAYLERSGDFFLIGDGFSLLQGGGLISLIASLGFVALIFLIYIFFKILFLKNFAYNLKILLVCWLFINIISGSIAIPSIGFIIGLILTKKSIFRNDLFESSAEARVNH